MALLNCEECQKEISSKAATCPHCGAEVVKAGNSKKCPYCAENIKGEAIICRFCGKDQPGEAAQQGTPPSVPSRVTLAVFRPSPTDLKVLVPVCIVIVVGFIMFVVQQREKDTVESPAAPIEAPKSESRNLSINEGYPAPWRENFNVDITKALAAKKVRDCGQYKYRESSRDKSPPPLGPAIGVRSSIVKPSSFRGGRTAGGGRNNKRFLTPFLG